MPTGMEVQKDVATLYRRMSNRVQSKSGWGVASFPNVKRSLAGVRWAVDSPSREAKPLVDDIHERFMS